MLKVIKKIIKFIFSWRLSLVLIAVALLMLVFELSYDFLMLNLVFKKAPSKFVNIGTTTVQIPANFRVAYEDYLDETDSLNAIYIADYSISATIGRMNFLNRNSNCDFKQALDLMNSRANAELFDFEILDVCGDSVWYKFYADKEHRDLSLVKDYSSYQTVNMRLLIPGKGIMFEIEAANKEMEDILYILKDFLYYDRENFYWNQIE